MNIVINIIVTLALLYWPVVLMMSPMMFAAPGADDDKGTIFTTFFFLSYPVTIFLLLGVLGGNTSVLIALRLLWSVRLWFFLCCLFLVILG